MVPFFSIMYIERALQQVIFYELNKYLIKLYLTYFLYYFIIYTAEILNYHKIDKYISIAKYYGKLNNTPLNVVLINSALTDIV
jgi:hypothetical protein